MRTTDFERGVLSAIETARLAVPRYGWGGAITSAEVHKVAAVFNLDVFRADPDVYGVGISAPAMLTAPFGDPPQHQLALRHDLPRAVENWIILHECAHVIRGDVAEPTIMQFTGTYPEWEYSCDVFAAAGLMDAVHMEEGAEWVEAKLRELVPIDDYAWQKYRIPELAPKVVRMRTLIEERL